MADDHTAPNPTAPGAPESPPASPQEALQRARRHALAAIRESIATVEALLDAAALAVDGKPASEHAWLSRASRLLEGLRAGLGGGNAGEAASLLGALADALDAEIARWERLARDDDEARSVLRAFFGLREVLWEFGVRSSGSSEAEEPAAPRTPPRRKTGPRQRPPRVQRVSVE
jgi:hypothetical protein